jgi:hypothetical protein
MGDVRRSAWVVGLVLLAGCSGRPTHAPPKETVEGRVLARGRPVPFVLVTFSPDDSADPNHYDGASDKDGSFRVQCPKGRYRVTLNPLPAGPGGDPGAGGLAPGGAAGGGVKDIPARYRTKTETPLTEDVPEGGKKAVTLEVR